MKPPMSCLIHDLVGFLYSGYSSMALAALACQQLIYIYIIVHTIHTNQALVLRMCAPPWVKEFLGHLAHWLVLGT